LTNLAATAPRQAVSPPLGKLHVCSQEWKASGVEYCVAVPAVVAAAEVAELAMAESLLHQSINQSIY